MYYVLCIITYYILHIVYSTFYTFRKTSAFLIWFSQHSGEVEKESYPYMVYKLIAQVGFIGVQPTWPPCSSL